MMNSIKLEIAVFNYQSALIAEDSGAERIELCENYFEGGITPEIDLIKRVKNKLKIPIHVIIRPRAGNFIYSNVEFELMKAQILICKELNINGCVFGLLNSKNEIDVQRCEELINLSLPMSTTFHRAFDECKDRIISLKKIIDCGFQRLLTSGGKNSVTNGLKEINELIIRSENKIIIIPGGGVRSSNIIEILNYCNPKEIHSSAISGKDIIANAVEISKMKKYLS